MPLTQGGAAEHPLEGLLYLCCLGLCSPVQMGPELSSVGAAELPKLQLRSICRSELSMSDIYKTSPKTYTKTKIYT